MLAHSVCIDSIMALLIFSLRLVELIIQQFQPISCLDAFTNSLLKSWILDLLCSLFHQNAFIKHKNIMEGIFTLHNILHHTQSKKKKDLALYLNLILKSTRQT